MPENSENIIGVFCGVIFFLALIGSLVFLIKEKWAYHASPRKYVAKQIVGLFEAIKDEEIYFAYQAFKRIVTHFKIPNDQWRGKIFLFGLKSSVPDDVNWELLMEKFIEVLNIYRTQISSEEDLSQEKIQEMIDSLARRMEEPYETNCLSCGAVITSEQDSCPKCGWNWSSPTESEKE